ncbi:MAG: D-tyrosyl-tRNA(Tyr) deacylase [Calditrichaeota bacterium]|nr:D-tyrosyl-tRNA(Tyr) deacylase [Calditrichota bacterium]MCB9368441.1 D-tyrosyl-tRNA(Tyr) deacylase [Calditrichota bacterium]
MKIVLQRVTEARVEIDGEVVGRINHGLLILLGIAQNDTPSEIEWGVAKVRDLRIFSDSEGKFNLSLDEVSGDALVVSQFTLLGDAQKGRRPSFVSAAPPEVAIPLYELFVRKLREKGTEVQTGLFGAKMAVHLVNDGPVTIILEKSAK